MNKKAKKIVKNNNKTKISKNAKKKKGFTLTELLGVIAILAIVISIGTLNIYEYKKQYFTKAI